MQFDDRLATVLRSAAQSEPGARTQYRQLLDLLGSMPTGTVGELVETAYDRLRELADDLPSAVQSAILRAPGLRLRNRTLVAWLARGDPQAAAAAMATAQLSESDWLYLIPRLPLTARGFLRHRRDLPFSARQVLERLGVKDLVLPEPELDGSPGFMFPPADERRVVAEPELEDQAGIGALVRRIEAFQRARREGGTAPRLPLGDARQPLELELARRHPAFDFATDAECTVTWADPAMAPLVVGMALGPDRPGGIATLDKAGEKALSRHLPLRSATVTFDGAPEIAGTWRIDAAPAFSPGTGHFVGYRGRMRRPMPPAGATREFDGGPGDRMRQVLHELRTPVNALQGFAELIQQQMFGPAPHEYRALAAAVAVDAARLMAGFDEIDRLARLETGALRFGDGASDLREVVGGILRRLDGVLRPRSAKVELAVSGGPFTVAMEEVDAQQLVWRLLATLTGALAPGEIVDLNFYGDGSQVTLDTDLPVALLGYSDLFEASGPGAPRAISAGMFGTAFTLRLARAEAEAAGGRLERREDTLRLVLPVLTTQSAAHTQGRQGNGGPSAA